MHRQGRFLFMLPDMINWFENLRCLVESAGTVILVTVITVRGSAPREIGAKILITETQCQGTVGGGNLEYKAIAQARELIRRSAETESMTAPVIHTYALGPSLGQCCGGQVALMYERVVCDTAWFQHAVEITKGSEGKRLWICRSMINPADYRLIADDQEAVDRYEQYDTCGDGEDQKDGGKDSGNTGRKHGSKHGQSDINQLPLSPHMTGHGPGVLYPDSASPASASSALAGIDHADAVANAATQALSAGWWCEQLSPQLPEVWIFGAGHVGQALHEQLQLLPCNAVAIDSRDDVLQRLPSSVRVIATDCCVAEVESAPAGAWFIVMTHSHAIDFDLCCAILKRNDFAYLGLIGSHTKRATFVTRLAHRGFASTQIDRLVSPIGLTTLKSRLPQLIALGVATDLAHQWQDTSV